MGLFLSSGCFGFVLTVFCSERERPFFAPSPAIRSPERAEGSRDRNASGAWRLAALATLVFRSALTPEHAQGRWAGDGPFFEAPRLMATAIRLRDDRRGARHWARIAHRKLVFGRFGPDHDAVMRIGVGLQPTGLTRGEAPGGGPILSVGIGVLVDT